MLFARAISRGARRFAPGIFGGSPVYTPDEMGADVDEEGNVVIDSTAVDVEPIGHAPGGGITISENEPEPKPETNGKEDVYQAVVDAGLSQNVHAAKNALRNYCQTGYDTPEKAVDWMKSYRGWRDTDLTPQEAGELANQGEVPK